MRKTVLMGIALMASHVIVAQIPSFNAKASDSQDLVLDSIVTKSNDGQPNAKVMYGYDSEKRKVYEVSVSYSEWSTPPYAPSFGDSTRYEYNQNGLLIKTSVYRNESYEGAPDFQLNMYTDLVYNDKDQLLKETTYRFNQNIEAYVDNTIFDYEYAEDGSLKVKIESQRPSGAPWETDIKPMQKSNKTEHSDFAGKDLPKKTESYYYSAGAEGEEGTWTLSNYSSMTYDGDGLLAKREFYNIDYQTQDWAVYSWNSYVYTNGKLTYEEAASKNYTTNEVAVDTKITYTYDANGNLEKITGERYQSYRDEWVADNPKTYHYSPLSSTSIRKVDASKEEVKVYYNAATKEICIEAASVVGSIGIYTVAGLEVLRIPAVNGGVCQQNVSGWQKGLYIVTLISNGQVYNEKVYIYE